MRSMVALAVRRRVTVFMAALAIVAFGIVGYNRLALELFPNITYPSLTVQTDFPDTAPQEVENLLVAGRCVSGDKISHAALRSMMCCTVTGQGAGVAAAVSLNDGVNVGEVDINRLQATFRKQGVRLD